MGVVTGVDVSDGMLGVAQAKLKQTSHLVPRLKFLESHVTDLESSPDFGSEAEAVGGSFDVVICSCAVVLFETPLRSCANGVHG